MHCGADKNESKLDCLEKYTKCRIIDFFIQYPSSININSGQTYFILENKVFYTNV